METTALASLFQVDGPFATVLVDVSHDSENGEHEHGLRVRAACDRLVDQGAPSDVVDEVARALMETTTLPAPVARFVVATGSGVQHDEVVGTRVDQPVASWSALPDLMPWITHADGSVTFVLALVDHAGGDVSLHSSDVPTALSEDSIRAEGARADDIHQVTVGGWAQKHYELRAQNAWRDSAEDVVEAISAHVRDGHRLVLLAGDPTSVGLVRDRVPAEVELVELSSGTRAEDGGDEALQQAIHEALTDHVVRRRLERVHELRERLGRGEAVATGVRDVAEAFVRGQVDTLLLDPATAAETQLDPTEVEGLSLGTATVVGPTPADRVLVTAAVLTSADVTVAPQVALGGAPVAALLRWDQQAEGAGA